ncbi:MAG: hypothetical protein WEB53_13865 [Akkermansiaceae bacterium]
MKAKKNPNHLTRHRHEEPLPHELGTHLFALIKRNLLARAKPAPTTASQLTFAF